MSEKQKRTVSFEIANFILEKSELNPIDVNSAFVAAWIGCNTEAIVKLCMAIIQSSQEDCELIAPHTPILTLFCTDQVAYEQSAPASAMLRGTQLVLLAHSANQDKLLEVLNCFEWEVNRLTDEEQKNSMKFMIYTKIMISELKSGAIPKFWTLVSKLSDLANTLSPDFSNTLEISIEESLGFIFINQIRQLKTIESLEGVFVFLNDCSDDHREQLLSPLNRNEFDVEMLFAGAWLSEHNADSIAPDEHEAIFKRTESYARNWRRKDIAVVARKYRAIILDEYANDKEEALKLLDEGLNLYGQKNHELVRAKAKIYHRSKDYKNSVDLSKVLIESDAPLTITEKAFLGREAGISAEYEGDFKSARKYYLYGSESAGASKLDSMRPMEIGLLADAALASWHDGDKLTCFRDLSQVFNRLESLDINSSIQAAHCHIITRHVALWLIQDSSGEKIRLGNDEVAQIFPGVVSNPEPHADIRDHAGPIEISWYLLAAAENYCVLDAGITQNLSKQLSEGPIFEGKFLLTQALLYRSLASLDVALFIHSIDETLAELAYFSKENGEKLKFDLKNLTYGECPTLTEEEKANFQTIVHEFALVFIFKCVFESNFQTLEMLVYALDESDKIDIGDDFFKCLISNAEPNNHNCWLAALICQVLDSHKNESTLPPQHSYMLVFHAVQVAKKTNYLSLIVPSAVTWFRHRWECVWANQKFYLSHPHLYEQDINDVFSSSFNADVNEFQALLLATLPTMGFSNADQVIEMIKDIPVQQ